MKIVISLMFLIFNMNLNTKNLIENVKVPKEILQKRKSIFIVKDKKNIGVRKIDESHLVLSLSEFIIKLKGVVEKKDLEAFVSLFSENFVCQDPEESKLSYKGSKACIKSLKMNSNSFWKALASTVEGGGCLVDKKYFSMPSVYTCDRGNSLTFQLNSKRYVSYPLKVYLKMDISSGFKILPGHYFYKENWMGKDYCLSKGMSKNCYQSWTKITSSEVGTGYVLFENDLEKPYYYLLKIINDSGQFKIKSISGSAIPR